MRGPWSMTALAGLALAASTAAGPITAARAEPTASPPDDGDPWRPGLLAPRAVQVGLGLWARRGDRALAIAPELWLGVGQRLTLGVSHGRGTDGLAAPGRGLCLRACAARYRGALTAVVALGPRSRWRGRTQLVVDDVGPATIAIELGASAAWRQGRTWARIEPALRLGLVGRVHDNRERAGVGLAAGARWADAVAVGVVTEPRGPADEEFFAGLIVPTWLEASVRLPDGWMLGATLGSDDLFAVGGGRAQASVLVAWRR